VWISALAVASACSSSDDEVRRCLGDDESSVCAHLVDGSRWEIRAEGLQPGSVLELRSPAIGLERYPIGDDGQPAGVVGLLSATVSPPIVLRVTAEVMGGGSFEGDLGLEP